MKKLKISIIILVLIVLLVPFRTRVYEDGGTKTYTSLSYKIIFWHELADFNPNARNCFQLVLFPNNFKSIDDISLSQEISKEADVNNKDVVEHSIQIIDANNKNLSLSDKNSRQLLDYLQSAIKENNQCERVKYLFTNQIYYIDEDGKENHFRFLTPSLVSTNKESMILIQDEKANDKCIKISVNFYEELKKIEENTKANFTCD